MAGWTLGIIGGSGLKEIPGLGGAWTHAATPRGAEVELFEAMLDDVRLPSTRAESRLYREWGCDVIGGGPRVATS